MGNPKILVFAGSIRTGWFNARLAALAARELTLLQVETTLVSLVDYPMPIYDGDLEAASGPPENALWFKRMMARHHGVFIAAPEYNASVPPLLKNTLDLVSRVREADEPPLARLQEPRLRAGRSLERVAGRLSRADGVRQVLELGCGALMIPDQIVVRDATDGLHDERAAKGLRTVLARLVEAARQFA